MSGGDPAVVSPLGAVGLTQVKPDEFTAAGIGEEAGFDPATNISFGSAILANMIASTGSVDGGLLIWFGEGCDDSGRCTADYMQSYFSLVATYDVVLADPEAAGYALLPIDWVGAVGPAYVGSVPLRFAPLPPTEVPTIEVLPTDVPPTEEPTLAIPPTEEPTLEIPTEIPTEIEDTGLSPRVSLNYQWTDDLMSYVSYTRGFKSGGFNARSTTPLPSSFCFASPIVSPNVDGANGTPRKPRMFSISLSAESVPGPKPADVLPVVCAHQLPPSITDCTAVLPASR